MKTNLRELNILKNLKVQQLFVIITNYNFLLIDANILCKDKNV